jgi:hypothetical protein
MSPRLRRASIDLTFNTVAISGDIIEEPEDPIVPTTTTPRRSTIPLRLYQYSSYHFQGRFAYGIYNDMIANIFRRFGFHYSRNISQYDPLILGHTVPNSAGVREAIENEVAIFSEHEFYEAVIELDDRIVEQNKLHSVTRTRIESLIRNRSGLLFEEMESLYLEPARTSLRTRGR